MWARLDDAMLDNAKIIAAGPLGFALHVAAITWCSRNLTDGFIPKAKAHALFPGDWGDTAQHLIVCGLWHDRDARYEIHDYLTYNPSKAEVLADREISRRRAAMNANPALRRALQERDGNQCRYCGTVVNWRDRKSPSGGTYDHITPLVAGGDESLENLVVCCRRCNIAKGPRTPDQAGMTIKTVSGRNLDGTQPNLEPPVPVPVPPERSERLLFIAPPARARRSRAKPKIPWPEDFALTPERAAYATRQGLDAKYQWGKFKAHALRDDIRHANWDQAWQYWIRNAWEIANRRHG